MAFIDPVPDDQATAEVDALYATDQAVFGHLPNFTRGFSHRPDVYAAWRGLNGAIKANMDLRRYELATIAAATRLRSSYCTLAHGSVLLDQFLDPDDLRAVVTGTDTAALDAVDAAVIALADKVADDATGVTQADADSLDVVLAAAARSFFSKVLDGLGIEADARFAALDPPLRDALTVGRPIAAP